MDYEVIEQAALAMSMDDRWDLGFLLLDTLDGHSEAEIDGGKAETPIIQGVWQAEDLKMTGKLSTRIDSELAQAALSLPVKERDQLATMLIHSLDEGIPGEVVTVMAAKAAWRVEIERRAKDLDSGKAGTIPWEEVKRKGHSANALPPTGAHWPRFAPPQ